MKIGFKFIFVFVLISLIINISVVFYQLFTTGSFNMLYSSTALIDLAMLAAITFILRLKDE